MRVTYSRAQRYGSNARMLGRAHVCRLNGDFVGAIVRLWIWRGEFGCYHTMFEIGGELLSRGSRVGDIGSHTFEIGQVQVKSTKQNDCVMTLVQSMSCSCEENYIGTEA